MLASFDFIGPITDESFNQLHNFIFNNKEITELHINLSSLGGSVSSGITTYNYLKRLKFPIRTHNLGEVSSAAVLLYLAGSTRTAEQFSKFLIHPISVGINGELPFYQVEEILKNIDADIKNFANIVNLETDNLKGIHDVERLLKNDSLTLNGAEAHQCGIITVL